MDFIVTFTADDVIEETRTHPLVGSIVEIDPLNLIDESDHLAVVVALGVSDSAWVRFPNDSENAFPISALTVVEWLGEDWEQHVSDWWVTR